MNKAALQPALRELRTHLTKPTTVIVLGGVTVIVAMAGPFDTGDALTLGPRLLYWLAIVPVSYGLGYLAGDIGRALWPTRRWRAVIGGGVMTGCAVTVLVVLINWVTFRIFPDADDIPGLLGPIFATALIISAMGDALARALIPNAAPPAILSRLPLDKRGALLALSVEDHYVRVRTAKGEEMLLMRLSDAMGEVGSTPGAQVHRSHWVAWDAVTAARREKDRAVLTLSDGSEVPVSRSNLAKLRDAGLLAR